MYLFGFGSLINLKSAQKSFERTLTQEDLIPVELIGYKKVWSSIESITFEDKIDVNGIFLNLAKDESTSTLGVMIEITADEFENLKKREKNYSCITVDKSYIKGFEAKDDVTFFMTTREDKIAKKGDKDCFIPSKYIDLVKNALVNYDEDYQKRYEKEALQDFPFPLKDGTYGFSDPIQNQFAREGVKK